MILHEQVLARLPERFVAKLSIAGTGGCWEWMGCRDAGGYGRFHVPGTYSDAVYAHRFAYETLVGPIPERLQIDHLCRVRHCVNPSHLEPVAQRENILRGESVSARNARNTHCPKGHELTPENIYRKPSRPTERRCRECIRAQTANWVVKRRARRAEA